MLLIGFSDIYAFQFRGSSTNNEAKNEKSGKDLSKYAAQNIVYERFLITSYALVPNTDPDPKSDFSDHNTTKLPTKSESGFKLEKSPIIK